MVRRLLGATGMLHPTLRELRALPPAHPPRGLAIAMLLTTLAIGAGAAVALARGARPGPPPHGLSLFEEHRRAELERLSQEALVDRGPR